MEILENIKRFIEDVVFPELVKDGMYSSFSSVSEGRVDFSANALLELKNGERVRTDFWNENEEIRVVVCDKVYPGEMLEFDYTFVIDEMFGCARNNDAVPNMLLIVRKSCGYLVFSWIRLTEFRYRNSERGLSIGHLKFLRERPQMDMTDVPGLLGEMFLRDVGCRDRLLLNYSEFFSDSCIREFKIPLDDDRLKNVLLGWKGNCEMPGKPLLSRQELDKRLKDGIDSIVGKFLNYSHGIFALNHAEKDASYYSKDVFDRVVGTVAYLKENDAAISDWKLIAQLSRMVAPLPMRLWMQNVAGRYQAMLNDELQHQLAEQKHQLEEQKAAALRDNSRPAFVDQAMKPLGAGTVKKIERRLKRATDAYYEEGLSSAVRWYGEAATLGSVFALEKLIQLEDEICDFIVERIDHELSNVVMHDKDRTFIRDCVRKSVSDLQKTDLEKILQIANGYNVMSIAVEEIAESLQASEEALSDSGWMFPDDHDDGESIDTMPWDNE